MNDCVGDLARMFGIFSESISILDEESIGNARNALNLFDSFFNLLPHDDRVLSLAETIVAALSSIETGKGGFSDNFAAMCEAADELGNHILAMRNSEKRQESSTGRIKASDVSDIEAQIELMSGLADDLDEESVHVLRIIGDFCEKVRAMIPHNPVVAQAVTDAERLSAKHETGAHSAAEMKIELVKIVETLAEEFQKEKALLAQTPHEKRAPLKGGDSREPAEFILEPPDFKLNAANPELADFISETTEYLESAETCILALEKDPGSADNINEIFRYVHNIKGIAGFLNIVDVQRLSHATETLLGLVRKGAAAFTPDIASATFESVDLIKEMTSRVRKATEGAPYETPAEYVEIMNKLLALTSGQATPVAVSAARATTSPKPAAIAGEPQKRATPELIAQISKNIPAAPPESADSAQASQSVAQKIENTVKVGTVRLDNLVDTVGELVIANSMLQKEAEDGDTFPEHILQTVSQLDKITHDLQELAIGMRMVSLKPTFMRMARIARDTAAKSNTKVDFTFSGEETEIDRNVVEEIINPLAHMVRNAVDHGIESEGERAAAGKDPEGKIHIEAYHKGGNVVVKLSDDGKGLDVNKIYEKALQKGLVARDAELDEKEMMELVFLPGLSTADKVTDLSGRGVGMDVVRTSVEALRGRVEIDSAPGEGSTFCIYLPLTLSIIDGMLVSCGEEKYIVPSIAIHESIQPEEENIATALNDGEMISLRGELMPMFRLSRLIDIENPKTNPLECLVLVMGDVENKFCVMVDDILGQRQVVLKSLGKIIHRPIGVSGAAVMGDGTVSLILDSAGLFKLAAEGLS